MEKLIEDKLKNLKEQYQKLIIAADRMSGGIHVLEELQKEVIKNKINDQG